MSRSINIVLALIVIAVLAIQACSSGGDSDTPWPNPLPTQSPAGVWMGYIQSTFAVGIVTEDGTARFVEDKIQYVGTLTSTAATLTGQLYEYTWDTSSYPSAPIYTSDVDSGILTCVLFAEKGMITGEYVGSNKQLRSFGLAYNTTYEVQPDLRDISGDWVVYNSYLTHNTLGITITTTSDPDVGDIDCTDNDGNSLSGEIEIAYSPYNIYNVNITLTDNNGHDHTLTGLATYVLTTEGVPSSKVLAIGATSQGISFTCLAGRPK